MKRSTAPRKREKEMDFGGRGGRRSRRNFNDVFDENGCVDYKNTQIIQQFVTERGRLIPRRLTGLTAKQQREITLAVKRARIMALIPFTATQDR